MKLRFGPLFSDVFLVIYILGTLGLRFYIEPQLNGHFLVSVGLGVFSLIFLWALIKARILNPSILNLSTGEE